MAVFQVTLNILSPIFLVIGAAYLFGRIFKPNSDVLGNLLLYVLIPALVVESVANAQMSAGDALRIGGSIVVLAAIIWGLGLMLARALKFDRELTAAFLVSIIMANAANYGIPLNTFAFGEAGTEAATVYYVIAAVVTNNIAIFIASSGQTNIRQALIDVVKVPVFAAAVVGLLLNVGGVGLPPEGPIGRAVGLIAQGTVPVMLMMLGIRLTTVRLSEDLLPIIMAAGFRLVLNPLIVLPVALAFGLSGTALNVTITQSATPTAVLAAAIAMTFNVRPDFVSAVILVSTLGSMVTMSILLAIMGG